MILFEGDSRRISNIVSHLIYHVRAFQIALVVKNLPANTGYTGHGFNSWSGRSPGGGNGNLLQYPCLENPMDRESELNPMHMM